jgi:hypothetical protein
LRDLPTKNGRSLAVGYRWKLEYVDVQGKTTAMEKFYIGLEEIGSLLEPTAQYRRTIG